MRGRVQNPEAEQLTDEKLSVEQVYRLVIPGLRISQIVHVKKILDGDMKNQGQQNGVSEVHHFLYSEFRILTRIRKQSVRWLHVASSQNRRLKQSMSRRIPISPAPSSFSNGNEE